ncbi:MAG: aminoglycoside phosphotransferase [Acidimicrobiales bacterium]|nr:aminoglycoside phosphotransferase [Acidimicrobiales bacterium]
MSIAVPSGLRHAVVDEDDGPEWLDSLGGLVERAVQRWDLVVGEPFETGMTAWTAPARTSTGVDVVLKLSFPHLEARDEAAALAAGEGAGAVELLGTDAGDWALLLRRVRPGTSLRDAALPTDRHLVAGAEVMRRMATVRVPPGEPYQDLVDVACGLAAVTDERIARLLPQAPYPVDAGLCRQAVELLHALPRGAEHCGLAHGDLNPGNILRQTHSPSSAEDGADEWFAIDPKPVHGDLAWDPWPLLTQVGDWLTVIPSALDLAHRTRLLADVTGLDASRVASWCIARGVVSGLWAADRGWWAGFRGADGDLDRAAAWARAAHLLGG